MDRKYSKTNFVEAVKIITPDVYLQQDLQVGGEQEKTTDLIINSHLRGINNITSDQASLFLNVSAIPDNVSFSAIDTPVGFAQFFIKQNKLTNITPEIFEKKIMSLLGKNLGDFSTSSDFKNYVSGTLLPLITLNSKTLLEDTSSVFATTVSGTHEYLITNLNWLYFLNTSGPVLPPSSIVLDSIVNKFYGGNSYLINDAIKDYQTYVWDNYSTTGLIVDEVELDPVCLSALDKDFIPGVFWSGTGSYTSGNQNLEKMKTFIDILYSPLYIDKDDDYVKKIINQLVETNSYLHTVEDAGPLNKFLRAFSYLLRDLDNEVESIETLTSITDCPVEFLPYLAYTIGWTLYGTNEISWRNQIANAVKLYKKKGTKQGIADAMNTIIVQNPIDALSLITELYESYIPYLLYYLLLTESPIFNWDTYTVNTATANGIDIYNATDMDINIRAAVDTILKNAVEKFPHLFFIRNEPFRVSLLNDGTGWTGPIHENFERPGNWLTGKFTTPFSKGVVIRNDPNFVFNFRGRDFPIPPWDDEKFYRNCIVTDDLLFFLGNALKQFCVDANLVEDTKKYIESYTLSGNEDTDLYLGNSYLFFTSSIQYPPNYDKVLNNYEASSYDALSLWNGKSSTFDFTVCAGEFSSVFFANSSGLYTVNEILDTLSIVDEFTPAKAIPRTRVVLSHIDNASGLEFACPSLRWPIKDVPTVSGLSNQEVSGVYDRGTGWAVGDDLYKGYDDSRSTVDHANEPVFGRWQSKYSNHIVSSVVKSNAVVPTTSGIPRRSLRRRDFYNTLGKKGWYSREGWNMPSFYNNTSGLTRYVPLGLIPSSLSFADGSPENLSGVYSRDCKILTSHRSFFGIDVSNTFLTRGNSGITFSSCDQYVRRDITPEEVILFFNLEEKKKKAIAKRIYNLNSRIFAASSMWVNFTDSLSNTMGDITPHKYRAPILDKRSNIYSTEGIQSVYNTYNEYFGISTAGSALPENLVDTLAKGGPNILSHTYGPLYRNANFSIDGPAVDVSSQIISRTIANPFILNLALSGDNYSDIGVETLTTSTTADGPYYGFPEYKTETILSGVYLMDTSTTYAQQIPKNEFIIYNLDRTEVSRDVNADNYLINNQSLYIKNGSHGLPRVKFDIRGASSEQKNILIPEHDFELKVKFINGDTDNRSFGGGHIGAILRTKIESTKSGERVCFVWTPNQEWKMVKVKDLISGQGAINNIVNNYAHKFNGGPQVLVDIPDPCNDVADDSEPLLNYVKNEYFQTAKIKFHTKNRLTNVPFAYGTNRQAPHFDVYNGQNVQVHRAYIATSGKTQNYFIEVFPLPGNGSSKFSILDKIDVVDKTLNEAAQIPYSATIPDINKNVIPVERPVFYTPLGKEAVFAPNVIGTATEYFSTNFLKQSNPAVGSGFAYWGTLPLDGIVFQPWVFDEKNYSVKKNFLSHFPTIAQNVWQSDVAPWGRIPSTGVNNISWSTREIGLPYMENSIAAKRARLQQYWESRKGFLSFNDWSEYIVVGRRFGVGGVATGTGGPGVGLFWWGQYTGGQQQPVRPLLGFSRTGHSYREQGDSYLSLPGISNPFGMHSIEERIPTEDLGYIQVISVGRPQELDFTCYRRDDNGIPGYLEDPLLQTIKDPLGYVPSSVAFKNMVHIALDELGNPQAGFGNFNWTTSSVWVDEGHEITFPPMSVYRDIERGKLINTQSYTFSMYVATVGGYETASVSKPYATSAILTVSPIGTKDSYTRLTLRLPKLTTETYTSSIETNGHTFTGDAAARISLSPVAPFAGSTDTLIWYRMEVTIPYDAAELDLSDKQNLGLRCTLQAYNDSYDGGVLPEGGPPNLSYEYIPCKLLTWGAALHAAPTSLPYYRIPSDVYGYKRGVHWGAYGPPHPPTSTMVYRSFGNIIGEEETIVPRSVVYGEDKQLYYYDKDTSGLKKYTVAVRNTDFTGFMPTKLYKKVDLYDSSGAKYDGKVSLSLDKYLLRPSQEGETEIESVRRLSVSGTKQGTNIGQQVYGSIPLEPREMLHLFRYFNKLGKSYVIGDAFNTRVPQDSSAIHDVSGGSRLSYRFDPGTNGVGSPDATYGNFTNINITN